jgi:hypothetical protein
MKVVYLVVY